MARAVVLYILDELKDEELKRFKFYLREDDVLKGKKPILKSRLETADRMDTVDRMIETYKDADVLEITKKVLIRISRNDLVHICHSRLEGQLQKALRIHKNAYSA